MKNHLNGNSESRFVPVAQMEVWERRRQRRAKKVSNANGNRQKTRSGLSRRFVKVGFIWYISSVAAVKEGGWLLSRRSPKSLIKSIKYQSIQVSSAND